MSRAKLWRQNQVYLGQYANPLAMESFLTATAGSLPAGAQTMGYAPSSNFTTANVKYGTTGSTSSYTASQVMQNK